MKSNEVIAKALLEPFTKISNGSVIIYYNSAMSAWNDILGAHVSPPSPSCVWKICTEPKKIKLYRPRCWQTKAGTFKGECDLWWDTKEEFESRDYVKKVYIWDEVEIEVEVGE